MAITGTRSDWTFIAAPAYNTFDIQADTEDTRPGSAGTRSVLVPATVLVADEQAEAVLTNQPSLIVSEATTLIWLRPEELTDLDHTTLLGIRTNTTLTTGFRAHLGHIETPTHLSIALETIADGTLKTKMVMPATDSIDWRNVRLSTSDITGYPTVLIEVLDGIIWRRRGYLVDRSGGIAPAATGTYSFGIRQGTSPASSGTRFDDFEVYLYALSVDTPLPLSEGFESGSWATSYIGVEAPSDIVKSIQADSHETSTGTNCLNLTNSAGTTQTAKLSIGVCDGIDRNIECYFKLVASEEIFQADLRVTHDIATGTESKYFVTVNAATNNIILNRRLASVDSVVATINLPIEAPPSCFDPINTGSWFGLYFEAVDNGADVDYVVKYDQGRGDGMEIVLSGTDAASPLVGSEGYVQLVVNIAAAGSVRIDDLSTGSI